MKTNTLKFFLILTGFQITWLSCVFGEYFKYEYLGIFVGIFYLFIFFYYTKEKKPAFKICLLISSIGYLFDSSLSFLNLQTFNSSAYFAYLPIWFIVLWLSFSTLFVDVLKFFKKYKFLAIISGAVLVPPTYLIGIPLKISVINNFYITYSIMVVFWGFLMFFYSSLLEKK